MPYDRSLVGPVDLGVRSVALTRRPDPALPPPYPRNTKAQSTAAAAPAIGPATYTQYAVQSRPTRSGPKVRAGFIDVPEIGLPHRPASAM